MSSLIATGLQPFVANGSLAGAVTLVATAVRVLDVTAVGFADIGAGKPMQPDSLFWIASMTKPMTAAALLMLVDEGRVNVADPVAKYLPEFKGQMVVVEKDDAHVLLRPPVHPITVHNILTHTSGLPFSSPVEQPTLDLLSLAVRSACYAQLPLQFEPDTKYLYSNVGTNLCGRIIEVVSGQAYADFLATRLLQPLGMENTTFWPNPAQLARLAKTYKADAAKTGLVESPIAQLSQPYSDRRREALPAGGLFSTAQDCARFCQMVLNRGVFGGRRYLSEAAVAAMTRKQTAPGVAEAYGYGWQAGDEWGGHGGALATNMAISWKNGLIAIYLVQHFDFPNGGNRAIEVVRNTAPLLQ
ncbi:MAG: D-aminopeptidase [Verrucomicrobiae bacterium]|nr:D-aminopeptidase [Verrucomicrobiae bacterium]